MTKNFGPVSKIILFIVVFVFIRQVIAVAYGWSLDQSELFSAAIVGPASANALAWILQLGPQAMFVAAAIAWERKQKRVGWVAFGLGVALNLADMYTNIVAFSATWPEFSAGMQARFGPEFTAQAKPAGYVAAILITFAEEAIALSVAAMIYLVNAFAVDMRWKVPPFLRTLGGGVVAASGAQGAGAKIDLSDLGLSDSPAGGQSNKGQQQKSKAQGGSRAQIQSNRSRR